MMNKELITKLIEIGRKEDFAVLETLFQSEEVENKGDIMRQGFQLWYNLADSLSEEEIVALMKAFTIAEKTLKGWKTGSVSPVIWLGIKLREREYKYLDEVREWVKNNGAHNDWLIKHW